MAPDVGQGRGEACGQHRDAAVVFSAAGVGLVADAERRHGTAFDGEYIGYGATVHVGNGDFVIASGKVGRYASAKVSIVCPNEGVGAGAAVGGDFQTAIALSTASTDV